MLMSHSLKAAPARTGMRGFSLVEMMVAMVAGLVLMGAVVAFTVSSLQSSSENIRSTRLSQELRTVMSLVSRELRRAGYNEDSVGRIGSGLARPSPHDRIFISQNGECIVFAYDAAGGTPGVLDPGETKGVRRVVTGGVGIVQYHPGAGGNPACGSDTGWINLTDPQSVNITVLQFDDADVASAGNVSVRRIGVEIEGTPRVASDIVRNLATFIRVRADCLRADINECSAMPGA